MRIRCSSRREEGIYSSTLLMVASWRARNVEVPCRWRRSPRRSRPEYIKVVAARQKENQQGSRFVQGFGFGRGFGLGTSGALGGRIRRSRGRKGAGVERARERARVERARVERARVERARVERAQTKALRLKKRARFSPKHTKVMVWEPIGLICSLAIHV